MHAGQLLLYQGQPFQGLHRGLPVDFLSGRQCESQVVEDQVLGFQSAFVHRQVINLARHFQLAVGCFCHTLLVNGQRQYSRAVLFCQGEYPARFVFAGFQVGGVYQAASRSGAQRGFRYVGFGRIDNQGGGRLQRKALDQFLHQLSFVAAFGDCHAHVQSMRAGFQLVSCDLEHPVVILRQQKLLKGSRTLRVQSFANQEWHRLLLNRHRLHRRSQHGFMVALRQGRHRSGDFFCQFADVFRSGAAAAAHHAHAVFAHKLREHLREWFRLLRINCLSVHVHRQPGIGDAGDGQGGMFTQVLDGRAHMFRPGRAVQSDDVDAHTLQDCQSGTDIGAKQHFPVDIQRHLRLDGQDELLLREGAPDALNCGLNLQDILLGLQQKQVGAALD